MYTANKHKERTTTCVNLFVVFVVFLGDFKVKVYCLPQETFVLIKGIATSKTNIIIKHIK